MTDNRLHEDVIDTPVGALTLRYDARGLHVASLTSAGSAGSHEGSREWANAFERYFSGEHDALNELPIVQHGTAFQKTVWAALRRIPAGQTRSYGELAREIGRPGAARAVGTANGSNPLCIVVPCHRVISADGTLGGFSAGLPAKRWLLRHEGATVKA